MSDEYFARRASRRTRVAWLLGGAAMLVLLGLLGLRSLFYDSCTHSYDRSPRAVIQTFTGAVGRGDIPAVQGCWEHYAYFDVGAGCSEICLAKVGGARFQVTDIVLGEASITPEGRSNLPVTVTVACTDSSETHRGEVLLDSVAGQVRWKHWAIVQSTFGGTVAEPWCK
jgi:hypothetical protein